MDLPKPVLFFVEKRIRKSFFTAGENSSKRIIPILFTDFYFLQKDSLHSLQHKFVKKKEFQKIFFLQNRSVKNFAHPWSWQVIFNISKSKYFGRIFSRFECYERGTPTSFQQHFKNHYFWNKILKKKDKAVINLFGYSFVINRQIKCIFMGFLRSCINL